MPSQPQSLEFDAAGANVCKFECACCVSQLLALPPKTCCKQYEAVLPVFPKRKRNPPKADESAIHVCGRQGLAVEVLNLTDWPLTANATYGRTHC